ncbi:uroplakin-1b isoform X2 [Talpa occidentalis]|uniref:uroplakin-1b isoform X2 n=1 Tax=Talpa occidentalis TaxID=50954 RepID=UPI00188FD91A|nr:uroplakin-1b isoform X2 [Talpa occidentalis]
MEARPEEAPEESFEPENTDKPPMDSHRDGQEDNQQDQGEGEVEDRAHDRTPAQAIQRVLPQTNTDGQADDTLHETSAQVDLSAPKDAIVANQRASDQLDQGQSEQSHEKAFGQAGYMESEQNDSQMSALLEENSPEQTERRSATMVQRRASKQGDEAAEQRDHQMSDHSEQRFSDQFDHRLPGLVQQKTSKLTDHRLPDQDDQTVSVKIHHKVHEQDEQVTLLAEDQAADQAEGSADHLTDDEAHGAESKEHDHFMDKEDDDMEDIVSGYRAHGQFDNRFATHFGDTEEVEEIESCTLETSQMNLKNSNISVSTESDTQSTTDLKKLESFESRLASGFQVKKHAFSKLFPTISTKFDNITSQEKTEATETKSGDISEHQQLMRFHEYPHTTARRFPPIVYEDPYQVSLRYMEKHNILQIFQLWDSLKMTKDDSPVRCFQGLLIFGNVIIGMCGIALTAECIFFVSDQHSLYPLLEATDNDDIYGAAWIGMFVGLCLFCLSVLGIVGIMKSNRKILLVYFILMFIVYAFEVASCITAATQRDFFTPNLFLKQMLERYQNNHPLNNDDQWKNNGVTKTWDRLMLQDNCCGVHGPSDWQKYTSAFRARNNDADYPWPRQCCVMNNLKQPLNLEACKLGVQGYYHDQGCYELISGPMNRHAWGVAWFGFAILCWTFWVLLGAMFYWSRIEY